MREQGVGVYFTMLRNSITNYSGFLITLGLLPDCGESMGHRQYWL